MDDEHERSWWSHPRMQALWADARMLLPPEVKELRTLAELERFTGKVAPLLLPWMNSMLTSVHYEFISHVTQAELMAYLTEEADMYIAKCAATELLWRLHWHMTPSHDHQDAKDVEQLRGIAAAGGATPRYRPPL